MKKLKNILPLLTITGVILAMISIQSCSKSSSPTPSGPSVSSVPTGSTVTVGTSAGITIDGTNLSGATVTTTYTGVTITNIIVATGGTSITGTVTVAGNAVAGTATLTITTSTGSTTTTITIAGIPLIGGFASSDSVESASLIAYFPFNGNANDSVSGNTATASSAVTYTTGIRGEAYQGAANAYATVTPGSGFSSVGSFSISVWFKLPAQQPSGDPGGMFFLSGTNTQNEMILETESYQPVSGDSVKIHHGFTDLASPGYQGFTLESYDTEAIGKWVHLVMTYDGGSSTYTYYQDAVPTGVSSAWSNGMYVTPTTMYDGSLPIGSGTPPTQLLGTNSFSSDPPQQIILGTWPAGLYGVSPTLGSNGCYIGAMDELRVYDIALTQHDVAGLYLNGLAGR